MLVLECCSCYYFTLSIGESDERFYDHCKWAEPKLLAGGFNQKQNQVTHGSGQKIMLH